MKAVIGLGNPGFKYEETRHNIGFLVVDRWAQNRQMTWKSRFRGKVAEERFHNEKIILLKPQTYMNLSGLAVAGLVTFYGLTGQDILVIHDDLDLPLGKLRLKAQGGPGGHNGLKSIQEQLGTNAYWRLKIGIGRPPDDDDAADHVLRPFATPERILIAEAIDKALQVVDLWLEGQADQAMNGFN